MLGVHMCRLRGGLDEERAERVRCKQEEMEADKRNFEAMQVSGPQAALLCCSLTLSWACSLGLAAPARPYKSAHPLQAPVCCGTGSARPLVEGVCTARSCNYSTVACTAAG